MNLSDFFPFNTAGSRQDGLLMSDRSLKNAEISGKEGTQFLRQVAGENTRTLMDITNLKPGQVFSGQITDIGQEYVTISSGGTSFKARFSEPVDLSISHQISFEIKGNENDTITIAPLREDFSSPEDALIYRALGKAGMAATDLNLDIGEALLKNGQTVDRQNLQKFAALGLKYPQASPEQLILLDKYGIKINESSIQYLNNYMQWNSKTTQYLSDISEALPKALYELSQAQGKEGLQSFFKDHLMQAKQSGNIEKPELSLLKELDSLVRNETSTLKDIGDFIKDNEKGLAKAFSQLYSIEPEQLGEGKLNEFYETLKNQMEQLRTLGNSAEDVNARSLEGGERRSPAENSDARVLAGNVNVSESAVQGDPSPLARLLDGTQQVLGQMDFLSQMNQGGSGGRNRENANKMMAFLPLKLRNKVTQGDLYVYSRQHGNWNIREGVSLYLHLDMEGLGELGIFMEMKQKFIFMKFSLKDNEAADLIKKHLKELDGRLLEKGYSFSGSVGDLKKEKPDFVKDFMSQGEKKHKVSRYSFDMRV